MTFLEASRKLYNFYFKESRKDTEILLYIDDQILNELFGENGIDLFLGLFTNIDKQFSYESREALQKLRGIEQLSIALLKNAPLYILGFKEGKVSKYLIKSDNSDYRKVSLSLILLLIYGHNSEKGIFLSVDEKRCVGDEQKLRKNVVDLLKILSEYTYNNSERGYVNFLNLYKKSDGHSYRYVGYFKYHTPLTRALYKTVYNIKNKNGFHYEIKDTNILENVFKEVLDDSRFNKYREVGYIVINKVINGIYKINPTSTKNNNNLDKKLPGISDAVFVLPSIFINSTGTITKLLRIHCQGGPSQLHLNIDGVEHCVDRFSGLRYKVIELQNWPQNIDANDIFEVNYSKPENTFLVPIKLNDIWQNVQRNEYVISAFSYSNYPCYYLSKDPIRIKALKESCQNTSWEKVDSDDLLTTKVCNSNIYTRNKGFRSVIPNTNYSVINIIDNTFYIKRHTSKWSYPYYFLPSITINKQENEKCFYTLNSDSPVELLGDSMDLNQIPNLQPGAILLYITDEDNAIIESTEKTIELLNEPDQKHFEPENYQLANIKWNSKLAEYEDLKKDSIDKFEDSYLGRILYTCSNYKDINLSNLKIYQIVDAILNKNNKGDLQKSWNEKKNILRDLVALGYLKKDTKGYEVRDLALIQTNFITQDSNYVFRLAGSRNKHFIEVIISEAIKSGVVVKRKKSHPSDTSLQEMIMPSEIYFLFQNLQQFENYLNIKINAINLSHYIRIIPYCERTFDNLKITNQRELYTYMGDDEPEYLLDDNFDSTKYVTKIDGDYKLIKQKNTNNMYLMGEIEQFGKKYFKVKDSDLAKVTALAKNKVPFVFSKNHGNKPTEYANVLIPCTSPYVIPQEYYTNLVYINGGLPTKISIKTSNLVFQSPKEIESIGNLEKLILSDNNYNNGEIEFYYFANIPTKNDTKKSLALSLDTKIYYITYEL